MRLYLLPLEPEGSEARSRLYWRADGPPSLLTLARTLASSSFWASLPPAALVVRLSSPQALGVIGAFDAAAELRLASLAQQLRHVHRHLRYVTYAQAERDCEQLAALLTERFGRSTLQQAHFVALPRGGLIVLGMLAYVLGLAQEQLESPPPETGLLVVVDDCAISGARFARFLAGCRSPHLVFAHLYSHPALREAIEARELRVVASVGARDLSDFAPERLGAEYSAWREHWSTRSDEPFYWLGQPEYLCFAWNEPDLAVWNPSANAVEPGPRHVPPELCLKHRRGAAQALVSVQVQPQGAAPLKPAPHVLFGELDQQVVIGQTETGSSLCLTGVAADMWRAIIACGDLEQAAQALLRDYEVDGATLLADLQGFAETLFAQGFLECINEA
jgi:hypothetical protein